MAKFKSKEQIAAEAAHAAEETERELQDRLREEYLKNKFAAREALGIKPRVEVKTDVTGKPKGE